MPVRGGYFSRNKMIERCRKEAQMNEADLVKIREALEKPSITEAIKAMGIALRELGFYQLADDQSLPAAPNSYGVASMMRLTMLDWRKVVIP